MYRSTRLFIVGLAGVAGLWGALQSLSPSGAVALGIVTAFTAACLMLAMTREDGQPTWGQAARTGLRWGAGVVASVGLISLLELAGLVVVLALVLTSPKVVTATRRRFGLRAVHDDAPSPTTVASLNSLTWLERPLSSMDDPTLCRAWRMSYVALQKPLALPTQVRIVERRRQFLDELERRDPRGFSAWLAAGPRAAGDPGRYIGHV
ncbi:MAG TPA: hypothetical protein VLB29_11880 [Nocardioidaceae bacterium]|nr:hypothetical protein [Nocardioidaceae bacterium]